jgi:hypothetical protein
MKRNDRRSFSLDRPGLRLGHRVKPSLRVVDTLTIALEMCSFFASLFLWVWWLRWIGAVVKINHPVAILAVVFASFLLALFAVHAAVIAAMRGLLLTTGLMTPEQAAHYPLRWGKRGMDPWPESWQEPDDP